MAKVDFASMLRNKMRLTALALMVFSSACGDDERVTPVMWTVVAEGAEGAPPSYLLGTMHLGVSTNDLPQEVWHAFSSTRTLLVETDLRAIDLEAFRTLAALPDGTTLNQLISSEAWADLLELLPGASPAAVGKLRPWAARMEVFRVLFPTPEGMDLTFLQEADQAQMTLTPLETWQAQLAPFTQIPLTEDALALETLLSEQDAIVSATHELVSVYKAGDWDQVQTKAVAAGAVPAESDPFYDTFIRNRNQAWLPQLEASLQNGGAFVAVGFGHLMGSDGLLAQLAEKGFTVSR